MRWAIAKTLAWGMLVFAGAAAGSAVARWGALDPGREINISRQFKPSSIAFDLKVRDGRGREMVGYEMTPEQDGSVQVFLDRDSNGYMDELLVIQKKK